jgi:hypothetical protein
VAKKQGDCSDDYPAYQADAKRRDERETKSDPHPRIAGEIIERAIGFPERPGGEQANQPTKRQQRTPSRQERDQ